MADPLTISGGYAPNPQSVNISGPSCSRILRETDIHHVASPSCDFNLQVEAKEGGNDLGDSCSFGELAVAMAANPNPHVGEDLRPDDYDKELAFIEGIPNWSRGRHQSATIVKNTNSNAEEKEIVIVFYATNIKIEADLNSMLRQPKDFKVIDHEGSTQWRR
ncbi:hypothetical protein PIB30_033459 [Stylosanthes scabra]|uniref:Uncharacterized protein n=1 Tax=Stylosanthes scabra TaxID=79078 RepID=A0ABU6VEP8_9FABA|nr:hypothetical protein [Stylosanthes scabra]